MITRVHSRLALTWPRIYLEPKNFEEAVLAQVGEEFHRRFFEGYTLKQWKRHPRDFDASVCGRIPVRATREDRYLREDFQALSYRALRFETESLTK